MRRELKNLLTQLTKHSEANRTFSDSNLELRLYYIFLRRYDAVRQDFELPQFGYDLENYIHSNPDCDPYLDLIEPFVKFLKDKNSVAFDMDDLPQVFKNREEIEVLNYSDFKTLNNAIEQSGISNFNLGSFSINEFDEFFTKLIEKTTGTEDENSWSLLSKNFAKLVGKKIPQKTSCLFVGDKTAEIAYQSEPDKEKKIIAGNSDSLLWYYLRIILKGEWNVEIIFNELASFIQGRKEFIFLNPAIGKISKNDRKDFSNHFGVDFNFRTWEGLYTKLALPPDRKKGKTFLLIPSRFLHANMKDYRELREFFVDSRSLQTVIRLPNNIFKGASSSVSFCLIEIDYAKKSNSIRFIDGLEVKTDAQNSTSIFEQISEYWQGRMGFYPYAQNIEVSSIADNKYSLAFSNYFNVSRNAGQHIRDRDEKLVSLPKVLKILSLKSANKIGNVPLLGITELAENLVEYEIDESSLPKPDEIKRAKKLDRSAILLGKIVGSVKPSYFKYDGQEIYIKPNVLAFDLPESINPQYIIQELRSDFVNKQFQKIESANVIPSFSQRLLKNIFLRVPPIEQQEAYYKDAITSLAKQSIEELKISDQEFRLVENKILSSFKHDFMQILLKVSSNIEVLDNYLKLLKEEGTISLDDSVFLEHEDKIKESDKVKSVIGRLKTNNSQSIKFLEDEVEKLTTDKASIKKKTIDVKAFLKKWKRESNENGFKIMIEEDKVVKMFNQSEGGSPYQIEIVEQDLRNILRNLLNNAIKHGFDKKSKNNVFRINLRMPSINDKAFVEFEVLNNGKPLPEDFSYEDLFEYKHKGPGSDGGGIGGYSIKKAVKNNRGLIGYNKEKENSDFPFRLSIKFPALIE